MSQLHLPYCLWQAKAVAVPDIGGGLAGIAAAAAMCGVVRRHVRVVA